MKILRLNNILRSLPLLVSVIVFSAMTGCATTEKLDGSTPEGAFAQAEKLEKDERYEEAITKYSEVKNKFPYSRFATQAELKVADVNYKREAFIESAGAYQLFKEFHPKHPQSDYVTFRLAESYYNQLPPTIDRDLSIADKAILYYNEVLNSYPNSEYAAEARKKREQSLKMLAEKEIYVGDFYAKRKKWDSALKRYEVVLKNYPNLGLDADALFGAAQSAIRSGERERGQQHLKNLYALFPESAQAKRAKHELE